MTETLEEIMDGDRDYAYRRGRESLEDELWLWQRYAAVLRRDLPHPVSSTRDLRNGRRIDFETEHPELVRFLQTEELW